jgi:UDP-N-acetylglucosamine--N-acetylmuramyl-(pentapeptide) pyrophosphoryl-undecaprenol N-acetylglucosamine transferase
MNATGTTVLIMAGGTGGHIYPALTIARELQARGLRVNWLGTQAGLEARVIGETDIPLHFISISGLRGKHPVSLLLAPLRILRAIWQSLAVMRRVRPDCVLGMGGFVTGPGGVAARMAGRKLLIHEQNAVAGLTNQLLCPLAHVVMEAFAGAFARKRNLSNFLLRSFIRPGKPVVVGNPVRADILALRAPQQRLAQRSGPLRLLVVGGSLGAAAINKVVPATLKYMPVDDRPLVRHQCGARNLEDTLACYRSAGLSQSDGLQVLPYIDNMVEAYDWADVVLCRAGASTIAELAAIGLPAILVPYPHAVDDHQSANAAFLEQAGGACVIPQQQLSPERLAVVLAEMGGDRDRLLQQAEASRSAGVRDGGSRAAGYCQELCHG